MINRPIKNVIRLTLFIGLLLGLGIATGCTYEEKEPGSAAADIAQSEPAFIENILYARADTAELRLNISIPVEQDVKYPLLIFIHGGGWQTGHRDAYNDQIQNAARRGFVAATISHRYTRTLTQEANLYTAGRTQCMM